MDSNIQAKLANVQGMQAGHLLRAEFLVSSCMQY